MIRQRYLRLKNRARRLLRWLKRPGPLPADQLERLRPKMLPSSWNLVGEHPDGALFKRITDGMTVSWGCGLEEDRNRWCWALVGRKNRHPSWDEIDQIRRLFLPRNATVVLLLPPVGKNALDTALLLACLDAPTVPALRRAA